ncbi:hypothetical protein WR25_17608 [Diploscapter pachys]|uniref:Uncharacterized protein n=1 Tax=Diploscapter pachys TaxID=2018661 RepID=A0A2A2K6M3_9BILA|nr:hypothetical protein WR25_17608 [Diploscapter pachys]
MPMTVTLCSRALGSAQARTAIRKPAGTALTKVRPGDSSVIPCEMAAMAVPHKLAASTMPHRRSVRPSAQRDGRVTSGSIAVIVLSVNSCIRPRMTTMNPTG